MQSTNPKDILTTLHLIRAALASGLMRKEEIIDWADKIITKDEKPDIFFIDLALSSSKNTNEILHYFNDYLNFENPAINGRPLLGLLYREFKNGHYNLEQAVAKLFRLKFEAIFNEKEEGNIYSIDDAYDLAKHNTYGTLNDVENELIQFLSLYKDYSIDNFEQWQSLDKILDLKLEQDYERHLEEVKKYNSVKNESKRSWWKFW